VRKLLPGQARTDDRRRDAGHVRTHT
jgi:hypothetical protein